MITAIEIENFKAFGERQRIELRPITLLFGPNSGGKSSILHVLQYAREILCRHNLNADRTTAGEETTDLGGFEAFLHDRRLDKEIILRFDLDLQTAKLEAVWPIPEAIVEYGNTGHSVDLSTIGDDVQSASVELIVAWVERPEKRARGPYVRSCRICIDGEDLITLDTSDLWDNITGIKFLNLNHPLLKWQSWVSSEADLNPSGIAYFLYPELDPLMQDYDNGEPTTESAISGLGVAHWIIQVCDPSQFELHALRRIEREDPKGRTVVVFLAPLVQGGRIEQYAACYRIDEWAEEETHPRPGPPTLPSVYVRLPEMPDCIPNLERGLHLERRPDGELETPWVQHPLQFGMGDQGDERAKRFALFEAILTRLIVGPMRLLRESLESMRYVGPIRDVPPRNYEPAKSPDQQAWARGMAAWDALYTRWRDVGEDTSYWLESDECLDTGYCLRNHVFREIDVESPLYLALANRRGLDDLELEEEFRRLGPQKSRVTIESIRGTTQQSFHPHDLGIGLSQVVPVVVACLLPSWSDRLRRGGIVALEQPELHLHPRQQAALGDLLIQSSIGYPNHVLIIETHSEHLILRILRRIRETSRRLTSQDEHSASAVTPAIGKDDVAVWYVDRQEGMSTLLRMRVSSKGEFLQPWPDSFFDQDYQERIG